MKISHHERLNPAAESDFLLSAWFQPNQIPDHSEDMVLVTKVDYSLPLRPGYSLVVSRRGSFIRPLVYWRDSQGKGGWYEFADMRLMPGVWINLILTHQGGTMLGLHKVEQIGGDKPRRETLGGFRLSVPVYPDSTAPFIIGARKGGAFRGNIGPIGIFSGPDVMKGFRDRFKQISRRPLALETLFEEEEMVFLSRSGQTDEGPLKLPIEQSASIERSFRLEKKRRNDSSTRAH